MMQPTERPTHSLFRVAPGVSLMRIVGERIRNVSDVDDRTTMEPARRLIVPGSLRMQWWDLIDMNCPQMAGIDVAVEDTALNEVEENN